MNLEKIGTLKVGTDKSFSVFKDEKQQRFLEKTADQKQYETLRKIADIAKDNENIIQIIGFHFSKQDQTKLFFYEPYLEGVTLEHIIYNETELGHEQVESIIYQLCLAVSALHENQLLHRDIKPANIFLTTTGVVKLLDFNITTSFDDIESYKNAGTRGYASPEQYGFDKMDVRSDIYSLGITIEKLISSSLTSDSYEFTTLIDKATAVDINNRFSSVYEIIDIISNKKNKFFEPQLDQIRKGVALGLTNEEIKKYAKTDFNAMQMGVIKHALHEKIADELIDIIADSNFSSRQMYQIKRGYEDGLSLDQIKKYSRPYLKPFDMAIYRTGIAANLTQRQIFNRINYYNDLEHSNLYDDQQLAFIRFCIYQNIDIDNIKVIAHSHLSLKSMHKIFAIIREQNERS